MQKRKINGIIAVTADPDNQKRYREENARVLAAPFHVEDFMTAVEKSIIPQPIADINI